MIENELPPTGVPPEHQLSAQSESPLKHQASRLTGALRERALKTGQARKSDLVDELRKLVGKLDRPGEEGSALGDAGNRAADWVRKAERLLEENSVEELLEKAERQVKARPGLFLAGCLALGFLGARLVRK